MDELASLDQSARENALERFQIIQPCLEQDKLFGVSRLVAAEVRSDSGGPFNDCERSQRVSRYGRCHLCGDDDSKPLDWFQSLSSKGDLGLLKKSETIDCTNLTHTRTLIRGHASVCKNLYVKRRA